MQHSLVLIVIAVIYACTSNAAVGSPADTNVIKELEARLAFAGKLVGESDFIYGTSEKVNCPCEKYCTGQCFSSGCIVCTASTWSFPGGEKECFSPGPLGSGLLCEVNRTTGKATETPCCNSPKIKSTCSLDINSCCSNGDCSTCPSYKQMNIFPSLKGTKRRWNTISSECTDI